MDFQHTYIGHYMGFKIRLRWFQIVITFYMTLGKSFNYTEPQALDLHSYSLHTIRVASGQYERIVTNVLKYYSVYLSTLFQS